MKKYFKTDQQLPEIETENLKKSDYNRWGTKNPFDLIISNL